jgi:hypothetical protein
MQPKPQPDLFEGRYTKRVSAIAWIVIMGFAAFWLAWEHVVEFLMPVVRD